MSPRPPFRLLVDLVPSTRLFGGLAAAALLLVACGENKDPLDTIGNASVSAGPTGGSNGNSSNSGNPSDPTEGGTAGTETGGPTEGTTSGSGAHGDCDQFLLCAGAVSPDMLPQLEMAYGPEGTCWTMPDVTEQCLTACTEALASFGSLYPDEPACGGGGPSTSTSGPLTSTSEPWPSTSEPWPSTSEPETTGSPFGNCGWDSVEGYYGCGGVGEDPEGVNPIECPPGASEGDPCDENTPINGIGCCSPEGVNIFCSAENMVYFEPCG